MLICLSYTLEVFKQAIRLYPPAYVITRQPVEPVKLDGCHIAAGRTVAMSLYAMHWRVDYFPEPQRFNPDRLALENERQLPRHAYMPLVGRAAVAYPGRVKLIAHARV